MLNVTNIFSNRLKELRGEKTLQEVASAIGITRVAMGYYEKGERKPDIEILHKIADYYKVSADFLIGLSNVKSPNMDIKCIADKTGLSETVIDKIITKDNGFLNLLISSDNFPMMDYLFDEICSNYELALVKAYRLVELEMEYDKYTDNPQRQQDINKQYDMYRDIITRSEERCDSASYRIALYFGNILENFKALRIKEIQAITNKAKSDTDSD